MLKKTIKYSDLDGNEIAEDFYFNLSKAEISEMELSHPEGFSRYLNRIVESQDGAEIIATFKKILTQAVGRRSEDGRRFIKNQEIIDDFLQSDAYSQVFMELVTDGNAAGQFITAIMPADMLESFKQSEELNELPEAKDDRLPYIRENREPTNAELMAMTPEQIQDAFRRRNRG